VDGGDMLQSSNNARTLRISSSISDTCQWPLQEGCCPLRWRSVLLGLCS